MTAHILDDAMQCLQNVGYTRQTAQEIIKRNNQTGRGANHIVYIIKSLLRYREDNIEAVKAWLQSQNNSLDGGTPVTLIVNGQADKVSGIIPTLDPHHTPLRFECC